MDHVVGVDVNPHAIDLAALNARLNGIANVELRQGDMFEPVAGEHFDLIVANPPFVISPDDEFTYRDARLRGDLVCRDVVRRAATQLEPGGWFHMLAGWPHLRGAVWQDLVAEWFEGTGCDGMALRVETLAPETYATNWIRESGITDPDLFRSTFDRWMAYYRELDIDALSMGVVIMRPSRSSRPWVRALDAPGELRGPAGDQVEALFAAQDFLHRSDDAAVLAARVRCSLDVLVRQDLVREPGGWATSSARVQVTRGLTWGSDIDHHGIGLLGRADGTLTVRELLAPIAEATGEQLDAIVEPSLRVVRSLIERGFLLVE
jgi:hypothetical protein